MKKKTKIFSSLALALVLGLGTAGCSLDKEKTNALMEKGETFLDAQTSEDYKKMYEDLKAYLEEAKNLDVDKIHDFLEKYDGLDVDALNKYLEEANTVTSEEAVEMLSEKMMDFVLNSLGNNYTVRVGNKVSRVEFVSDKLTKIYFYTEGENGEKLHEVYREITDQFVITYVKDVKLYSKVPVDEAVVENNLLGFYNYSAIASVTAEKTWEDILGEDSPNDYNDGYDFQVNFYELAKYLPSGYMGDTEFDRFSYSTEDGVETFTANMIMIENDDTDEEFETFTTAEMHFKFEGNSLKMGYENIKMLVEGNPIPNGMFDNAAMSYEVSFDEENTVNFDKSEYRLVEDYLANPGL